MPAGLPKALDRGRGRRAARRRRRRRPGRPARPGDPRGALRHRAAHLRAGRAVARPTSTSTAALLRAFGKGAQGAGRARSAGWPAQALDAWLDPGAGRRLAPGAVGPARRRRGRVPQPAGRPADPPGRVAVVRRRGDGGRPRRPAQPPRAAPLAAPPTCSTTAPTSAPCRSCSATRRSPRRRCTRRSPPSGCGRCTGAAHPRARRRPAGRHWVRRVMRGSTGYPGQAMRDARGRRRAELDAQLEAERVLAAPAAQELLDGRGRRAGLRRELRRLRPGGRRAGREPGAGRLAPGRSSTTSSGRCAKLDDGTYGLCEDVRPADRRGPARGHAGHPVLHRARLRPRARPCGSVTSSRGSSGRCGPVGPGEHGRGLGRRPAPARRAGAVAPA